MQSFNYVSSAQRVIFGTGIIKELAQILSEFKLNRLMLCTTPHLVKNGTAEQIKNMLGDQLIVIYDKVKPHVPYFQLEECLQLAEDYQIDSVIGLGGGSPIGMAKAIALELEAKQQGISVASAQHAFDQPIIPSIAIPTTYTGSEMTPVYGVSRLQDDGSMRKVTVRDYKITSKLTIYDPMLTIDLPVNLTASTGINALAHCIEAVYSATRNPLSTATALHGIKLITTWLLKCIEEPDNLEARSNMLMGAHMGGTSLATVVMGVHHGTCHVLGGTAGIPHGIANSIILPHAIRYNADQLGDLIALAGEAMGLQRDQQTDQEIAEATAQAIYELISKLNVPQRLQDTDIDKQLLPKLAENMLKSKAIKNNPKPVNTFDDAMSILNAAW